MRAPELYHHITAMGIAVEAVGAPDVLRATELIAQSRAARQNPADSCLSLANGICLAVAAQLEVGTPLISMMGRVGRTRMRLRFCRFSRMYSSFSSMFSKSFQIRVSPAQL